MIPPQQPLPDDSLAAVLRQVFAVPKYEWSHRPSLLGWLADLAKRWVAWLEALRAAHPVVHLVLLGALTAVALGLFVHLGSIIWRALRSGEREAPGAGGPSAPVRDADWHLAEARRLGGLGRYADALAHRFVALVLELDRRHAVTLHPAKTPAEYAREARLDAGGRQGLEALVSTLYAHLFGGTPCGPEEWAAFDHAASLIPAHGAAR